MLSLGKPYSGICSLSFPSAAGITQPLRTDLRRKKPLRQLGKQKDFSTNRLNVSAPEGVGTGSRGVSAGENKANCYLSQPEESWEHFKT